MKRPHTPGHAAPQGPSQRQLRAGELVRHALVEIFREHEINDPALVGVSVTVAEGMGPDLRHANVFVEPLGGQNAGEVVKALNKHSKFVRGHLGRMIDMRFTPDLHFRHDDTFAEAERIAKLFDDPKVQQDLVREDFTPDEPSGSWKDED
jgi:ribosome-binding factor A